MATKKPITKKPANKPVKKVTAATKKSAGKPCKAAVKPIEVKKPIQKAKPQKKAVEDKMKLPNGGKVFVKVCDRPKVKPTKKPVKKALKK